MPITLNITQLEVDLEKSYYLPFTKRNGKATLTEGQKVDFDCYQFYSPELAVRNYAEAKNLILRIQQIKTEPSASEEIATCIIIPAAQEDLPALTATKIELGELKEIQLGIVSQEEIKKIFTGIMSTNDFIINILKDTFTHWKSRPAAQVTTARLETIDERILDLLCPEFKPTEMKSAAPSLNGTFGATRRNSESPNEPALSGQTLNVTTLSPKLM